MMNRFDTTPFDWFNFTAQNCNSNALIQFVLKANNTLNFDLLRQALHCCITADPVLGCYYLANDIMPQWIENEYDIAQLCNIIVTDNVDDEITRCLAEKIDASKECPVKIYMLRSENESFIVIKTHHALCDAAGALQFVRLLAEMYSRLEENPDFQPIAKTPCRGTESFYQHFKITDKAANFNPALLPEMQGTWGTPYDDVTSKQTFAYQTIRFQEAELQNIKIFAKANDSSLNAVITAAYHRALVNRIKPSDEVKEIQFSANLRHYADEDKNTICNLSNLYNIKLSTKGSFAELAKEAKKAIDKIIAPEVILQSVLACELMSTDFKTLDSFYASDWENVKTTGICTPMISNIGRMDDSPICFGSTEVSDMFLVSPAFISPSFMLSAGTYRNVMTLCIAYQKPSIDDVFVKSLLEEIKIILTNL